MHATTTPSTHHHATRALTDHNTALLAVRLANRAVLDDIHTGAVKLTSPWPGQAVPQRCWDTRPMLDPNEHALEVLDMATEALAYAESIGLIERHPQSPWLVRVHPSPL